MSSPTHSAASSADKTQGAPCCCSRMATKAGWIVAATMAILVALLAARVATFNTQINLLQQQIELARLETQSLKQQLEAERILNARQLADLTSKEKPQSAAPATP